ncbi:hypothetical protein FOL47_000215 [Perkinsus chesapeaki]|uniref:Uncharacterized protein n=1 Tax=Perkinsus chesapeaki TaxID=330153 RepID=A0A7J6KXW3_PERCH|nr:hypothetical protein FOL47_000215 [Perkinsus chesapeaki]
MFTYIKPLFLTATITAVPYYEHTWKQNGECTLFVSGGLNTPPYVRITKNGVKYDCGNGKTGTKSVEALPNGVAQKFASSNDCKGSIKQLGYPDTVTPGEAVSKLCSSLAGGSGGAFSLASSRQSGSSESRQSEGRQSEGRSSEGRSSERRSSSYSNSGQSSSSPSTTTSAASVDYEREPLKMPHYNRGWLSNVKEVGGSKYKCELEDPHSNTGIVIDGDLKKIEYKCSGGLSGEVDFSQGQLPLGKWFHWVLNESGKDKKGAGCVHAWKLSLGVPKEITIAKSIDFVCRSLKVYDSWKAYPSIDGYCSDKCELRWGVSGPTMGYATMYSGLYRKNEITCHREGAGRFDGKIVPMCHFAGLEGIFKPNSGVNDIYPYCKSPQRGVQNPKEYSDEDCVEAWQKGFNLGDNISIDEAIKKVCGELESKR